MNSDLPAETIVMVNHFLLPLEVSTGLHKAKDKQQYVLLGLPSTDPVYRAGQRNDELLFNDCIMAGP